MYKMSVDATSAIFVNVKSQICSVAPVFSFSQISLVLVSNFIYVLFSLKMQNDILGITFDKAELEKTI